MCLYPIIAIIFLWSGLLATIRAGGRRSYSLMQHLTIGEFQRYIELCGTFMPIRPRGGSIKRP